MTPTQPSQAVEVTDTEVANALRIVVHADGVWNTAEVTAMREALEQFASQRMPVALPAEPVDRWTVKDVEDMSPAPVPSTQALAAGAFYPQVTGYATQAPKQRDAKDAQRYRFWRDCWGDERFLPTLGRTITMLSAPLKRGDYNNFDIVSDAAILASKGGAVGEGK